MVKFSDNPLRREINRNFLIRYKFHDHSQTYLVSGGQYHKIVGEKFKAIHFKAVLEGRQQNFTFFIRNRLKINFIRK